MLERKSDFKDLAHRLQRERALARSRAGPRSGPQAMGASQPDDAPPPEPAAGEASTDVLPLTNAELTQLHARVIALENLVVALLAEASDRQLALARDMAPYIAPRPGFTRHPLTLEAAALMTSLVERAGHFRALPPA